MKLLIHEANKINKCIHRCTEVLNGEPMGHSCYRIKVLYAHWLGIAGVQLTGGIHQHG